MMPPEGSRAGEARGDFVWCPPGRFRMGFEEVEVTISRGFWIGKNLVTQAQYEEVTGTNPSGFVGADLPVESVFRHEAESYARERTRRERAAASLSSEWEVRLPTEAQWEYACRAGTTTAYSFGDDRGRVGDHAWFRDNSGYRTHPVGTKKPNPWGLYDMHGNCLEFTRDAYLPRLSGGADPEIAAADVPERPGESPDPFAVGRGGGWFFPAEGLQSRVRSRLGARDRGYQLGFRVALVRVSAESSALAAVTQGVEDYLRHFREGRYEEGVALMAPGMTAYAPTGWRQDVPDDREAVVEVYRRMHAEGQRLLLRPEDIRVAVHGDLAVATFVTRGTWWVPPGRPEVARRTTQVWKRFGDRWAIVHGHHSDHRESP